MSHIRIDCRAHAVLPALAPAPSFPAAPACSPWPRDKDTEHGGVPRVLLRLSPGAVPLLGPRGHQMANLLSRRKKNNKKKKHPTQSYKEEMLVCPGWISRDSSPDSSEGRCSRWKPATSRACRIFPGFPYHLGTELLSEKRCIFNLVVSESAAAWLWAAPLGFVPARCAPRGMRWEVGARSWCSAQGQEAREGKVCSDPKTGVGEVASCSVPSPEICSRSAGHVRGQEQQRWRREREKAV